VQDRGEIPLFEGEYKGEESSFEFIQPLALAGG